MLTDADQRIMAGLEKLKRELAAGSKALRPQPLDEPPLGMSDEDREHWWRPRLEALKGKPTPMLSEAIKATNAGRDWGAPDITYGPARAPQEAAE